MLQFTVFPYGLSGFDSQRGRPVRLDTVKKKRCRFLDTTHHSQKMALFEPNACGIEVPQERYSVGWLSLRLVQGDNLTTIFGGECLPDEQVNRLAGKGS